MNEEVKQKKILNENNTKLIQLAYTPEQVYPKFCEKSGKKFIYYGEKNDYPNQLIELKNLSPIHCSIIDSISYQIAGKSLKIVDDVDDPKLLDYINQCNSKGESLHDVFSKIIYDYTIFNGWTSSIVWKKSKELFEIYHTDFSTIRSGKVDEKAVVNDYFFSENWKKSIPEIKEVPSFSTENRSGTQLFYFKKYSPSNVYYPLPSYIGSINWILLDIKIGEFENNYLDSGCFPSLAINYNNGIPSDEIKDQIYQDIMGEYKGSSKAGKIIITFSEGKDSSPEITPLNSNSDDSKFEHLSALVRQQILSGHKITSPELIGVETAGKLGNSSFIEAQQLFFNTVIAPKQNEVLKEINFLLKQNGFKNEVEFEQVQPIEFFISEQSMLQVLTINEIREKLKMEPIEGGDIIPSSKVSQIPVTVQPTDPTTSNEQPVVDDKNLPDNKIATA